MTQSRNRSLQHTLIGIKLGDVHYFHKVGIYTLTGSAYDVDLGDLLIRLYWVGCNNRLDSTSMDTWGLNLEIPGNQESKTAKRPITWEYPCYDVATTRPRPGKNNLGTLGRHLIIVLCIWFIVYRELLILEFSILAIHSIFFTSVTLGSWPHSSHIKSWAPPFKLPTGIQTCKREVWVPLE